jgi:hypothetical protein
MKSAIGGEILHHHGLYGLRSVSVVIEIADFC